MVKNYIKFFSLFILLFANQLFAQQKNIWSKIDEAKISNTQLQRTSNVKRYQTFHLKINDLKSDLRSVPKKNTNLNASSFKIQFPDANGKMISYFVKESPVMHPDLAIKFPNNKSYKGVGVDDNSLRIRFSVNEKGLHAMIIDKNRKVQYIDPISKDNLNYRVYTRKDMQLADNEFQCFTESIKNDKKSISNLKVANDKKLRTYRLALASTAEYSQYHIDAAGVGGGTEMQKKAAVLAEMTTLITRINDIFENDLALSFQLVANNDTLIFLDTITSPYTNDNGSLMLSENQTTCDNIIGTANYDIGHVLSTGGGGVAALASACSTSSKAKGVTGSANPKGDFFYFDFVAHEFGHQLGANHTFNGDAGNCAGNRNNATAVEPGSGSTLMAYASLCSPQNVQNHSDLYFSIISIDEIWTNITTGNTGNCATLSTLTTNLFVPVANAGNDFIIPKSTPYILRGQGSDGDNDPISFCWEQVDNQITTIPPSETATSGALYRSINPKLTGDRYMPDLSTVVAGNISSLWEVTPSVARDINFKLTVRDNNIEAGQVAEDALKVTVTGSAGPFLVTSQNTANLVWDKNTTQSITWDVAGTTGNGVNVSNVNILLSTDGGLTFATILASNTPNDGNQSITVPNTSASKCFVMVEAVGNLFYAINSNVFSIGQFNEVCKIYPSTDTPLPIPDNDLSGVISSFLVSDNYTVERMKVTVKINHTWVSDLTLTLESPSGTIIELLSGACFDDPNNDIDVIFDDNGIDLICGSTPPVISGNIKPSQMLSSFAGENSSGTWKLKVVDDANKDTGTIENWSIELCTSELVLGVNLFVFEDFKVYPNPSNGIFNVQFTSKNTSDVEITVFDLLGRKISQKKYFTSATSFNETVNINQISSGLYILQVKRGNEVSSQKLQIR
jgi:subtilisin-like proprotein convertase family protein